MKGYASNEVRWPLKTGGWLSMLVVSGLLLGGCASSDAKRQRAEKGPQGTVAYTVTVEASEPGVKIEANGDYCGTVPATIKIFGDKDGTFHNFGNPNFIVRAIPTQPGQRVQTKVFGTGGWFGREDRIPSRIYFEMNLEPVPANGGTTERPQPGSLPPDRDVPKASGTGFFITEDGFLITNDHVVDKGTRYMVVVNGLPAEARLIRKDKSADLALLKSEVKSSAVPLAKSGETRVGQQVYSLGFPLTSIMGVEPKFTTGIVNALTGIDDDSGRLQFSAQIAPGNSGGPLVNESGNVVGVSVATLRAGQNVNYAVKSSRLRSFVEDEPSVRLVEARSTPKMASEDLYTYLRPSTALVIVFE